MMLKYIIPALISAAFFMRAMRAQNQPVTLDILLNIQNNGSLSSAFEIYPAKAFDEQYSSEESVYVMGRHFQEKQMGNIMEVYFEAVACCDVSGVHFVNKVHQSDQVDKFFHYFPEIRLHPNPSINNHYMTGAKFRKACPGLTPWPSDMFGAWAQRPNLIGELINNALDKRFANLSTVSTSSFDSIQPVNPAVTELPLVPTAVIMFRCVDILGTAPDFLYGFLPFEVYKQLIPHNATHIYILSEPLNYLDIDKKHKVAACVSITADMISYLRHHFPAATVALRRGHPIDGWAMMARTEALISAPSTFSFYPGMANKHKVYFSPGGVVKEQPYLSDHFYYITYPEKINPQVDESKSSGRKKLLSIFRAPLKKPVVVANCGNYQCVDKRCTEKS